MHKTAYNYVAELFKLACQYNADDFHIFCELSGHINQISLRVYCGGWKADKAPDYKTSFYCNPDFGNSYLEYEARRTIIELTKLHRLYRNHGITSLGNWG